jgi:hypothetical protein
VRIVLRKPACIHPMSRDLESEVRKSTLAHICVFVLFVCQNRNFSTYCFCKDLPCFTVSSNPEGANRPLRIFSIPFHVYSCLIFPQIVQIFPRILRDFQICLMFLLILHVLTRLRYFDTGLTESTWDQYVREPTLSRYTMHY